MRGNPRHSTSCIGLAGKSLVRTARWRISRRVRSPVLSDASDSALPSKRADPPGARLASMKSSMRSAVTSEIASSPKNGMRCLVVKER